MAFRQSSAPDEKIKYLVTAQGGDFVIEIPANWKPTFGAVNPAAGNGGRHDLHCMRIWEGDRLRGVFGNVSGFRDLSMPMARKVQSETRASSWTQDSTGNFSGTTERQIGPTSWDPDDVELPFG